MYLHMFVKLRCIVFMCILELDIDGMVVIGSISVYVTLFIVNINLYVSPIDFRILNSNKFIKNKWLINIICRNKKNNYNNI